MGVSEGDVSLGAGGDAGFKTDGTAARLRVLGLRFGGEFSCVLPAHNHGAELFRAKRGFWMYRCQSEDGVYALAEVYAAARYGETRRLSPILASRWKERLDYEAGLRAPDPVRLDLPAECPAHVRQVGVGLKLFLGLRDERLAAEPFPFARGFVIAYCAVTDQLARDAVRWLEVHGFLERAGVSYRSILWRLRTPA